MRLSYALVATLLVGLVGSHAAADSGDGVVARLEISGEKDRAVVTVAGSFTVPTYSIDTMDEGRKVVINVADAELARDGVKVGGSASLIVRSTASTTAHGVRIVLGLTREATFRARADAGRIRITFDGSPDGLKDDAEGGQADADQLQIEHTIIERRDGRERVVIELNKPSAFRVVPGRGGVKRLEIPGAQLGHNVRPHLVGDSRSVVKSVDLRSESDRVVVEVTGRAPAGATAIREGNRIVWLFAPSKAAPSGRAATRTVAKERAVEIDGEQVAAFLSDVPTLVGASRGKRRFQGRKIDLDFKDADIHNILRLLSEVGNVNIVTADDVGGTITIKMKSVPWDQALDVILTAKALGMVRRGNLIRVAPQTRLNSERDLAIARQKQKIELAPLETRLMPVSYGSAIKLQTRVQELLTGRGKVSTDDRTNILIVRDVAETLDDIEELIRSLDSQTPQVLIEARIVEATTSFSNEFGIQWGGDMVFSSATGNPTGLVFPHDVAVAGGASDTQAPTQGLSPFSPLVPNPNFVVNLPAPAGTGAGGAIGMSLGSLGGNFNLNLRLSAFETTGQVRIISSPRILTLDNHAASIEQGTSIPYSQVSAQGVQTAFQEASLKLAVTPHVTSDGAVSMEVDIARDEPDFNQTSARGDPTILKRSAKTALLVQDGHTAVIGGIYTRNTGRGLDQVPFFGDIPILGILFQHHTHRDARNELLIFLTPRIVNRVEALSR